MQKKFCLSDVTLTEFYRHDCRISESSFVSLTTNMLHNLFFDAVISSTNFHLRLAIVDSVDKQLNISRHSFYNILRFSVKNFPQCIIDSKIQGLKL